MEAHHLLLLAALTCSPVILPAQQVQTVRLLTVGNSFSANATNHLGHLAKAAGHVLIHQPLVVGGASLQLHAEKAQKHEANAKDKAGLYTSGLGLRENLLLQQWDYVSIQQASIKSYDYSTYQPHGQWLRDYILKHAPQARLLVHQTWAYRVDDPRFRKPSSKPAEPKTQAEMYKGLTTAYNQLADEVGGKIVPVGDAFFLADTDENWAFRPDSSFDPKTAKHPSLPLQTHSLHVGWRWLTSKDGKKTTLSMDGHHASLAGEYLGACVWYEVLFGQSAEGNSYLPKGMNPADASFLQAKAHQAVTATQRAER